MSGQTKQHTILVVDDEPSIVDVLRYNLEKANFSVLVARDGEQALQLAAARQPDLIVLDLMLPGIDGLEVCRSLRKEDNIPIIMLTARDEEIDRVVGLELGADDYVVKPFSTRELIARIKSVLRRAQASEFRNETTLQKGSLSMNLDKHEAHWDGELLELSALEFDLLETLIRNEGHVLTREQLISTVWGYDFFGDTRAVDTAVRRLRARLREANSLAAESIATVRGVGYRLDAR
ncbi:MAG: response regulator transcription factor [Anaerolineales bacterium]|nr:MAG: response regulator transcription factor [Anaerolineales bacterium]